MPFFTYLIFCSVGYSVRCWVVFGGCWVLPHLASHLCTVQMDPFVHNALQIWALQLWASRGTSVTLYLSLQLLSESLPDIALLRDIGITNEITTLGTKCKHNLFTLSLPHNQKNIRAFYYAFFHLRVRGKRKNK